MAAATRFNSIAHSQKFTRKFGAFDKEVCKPVENQDAETMLWDPDRIPVLTIPQLQGFVEQHVVVLDTFQVAGLTNATSLRRNIVPYAVAYRLEFDRKTEQEIQQGQRRFRLEIAHVELQNELAQLQILTGQLGTENGTVLARLAEVERLLQEAVTTNTEDKSQSDTAITGLKTKLKEKVNQITDLTKEVNNKQTATEKMQTEIHGKLVDKGDLIGAMQWHQKCTQSNLTVTKMRLDAEQYNTATGAIVANTGGDVATNAIGNIYGQYNVHIASDTVPKEQYDNDIKEETDRSQRERASLVEDHRLALAQRDDEARNSAARLQQKCIDWDNKCIGMGAKMYTWESRYNNSEKKNKELKDELTVVKQEREKWREGAGGFERALADETAKFEGAKDVLSRVRGFHITERKTDADRYQALLEENLRLKSLLAS